MKKLMSALVVLVFLAGVASAEEETKYKGGGGLMYGTHVEELAINLNLYKTGAEDLGFLSFLQGFSQSAMIGGDINFYLIDTPAGVSSSFITISGNVLPALTVMNGFDIYGLGGINIQRYSAEVDLGAFGGKVSDSSIDFGINGGGGASKDLGFADLFGEVYLTLGTESQLVLGGGLRKGF